MKPQDEDDTSFSGRLKKVRESLGLTQKDFSGRLGVAASQYSRIEKGEFGLTERQLKTLSKDLGVDLNYLITGTDTKAQRVQEEAVIYSASQGLGVPVLAWQDLGRPPEEVKPRDYFVSPFDFSDFGVSVNTDALAPEIIPSDIVFFKVIEDRSVLPLGSPYLIETGEFALLRILKSGSAENSYRLEAINKKYDAFEVSEHSIKRISRVVGSVRVI